MCAYSNLPIPGSRIPLIQQAPLSNTLRPIPLLSHILGLRVSFHKKRKRYYTLPDECTVLRHPIPMYVSQYPPPDRGNSFCLVIKIRDSVPKGPRFKTTYCHSDDPDVIPWQ
ncbi:hypothetical protein AVEN_75715-1 [Araneus ventricosus]|uniref:Uncharacterized protein n=1 Tax=Araneus ventricosus TaxID=182803 RepID=A0A4Y2RM62_ARAVE|nr:hypothetical protein AVEN_75715-1 [Araneus ventricosus]